ncbi:hypothetical protein PMAYCL1PPCAC_13148, partial [Pristionchus mayeri]
NFFHIFSLIQEDLQQFFEKTLQFYSGLQIASGSTDHTADLPEIPRTRKHSDPSSSNSNKDKNNQRSDSAC